MDDYTLLHGDCLTEMAAMDAGSVDAVVCDPPYLLGFMGKKWDRPRAAQEWHYAWATFAFRTLRPSCYMVAFGGTRTWHRLACAIEDAGFEIRDTLMWLYGSGFPKGKSCLKPAWEPIILARKPGPMRELGIEECRVPGVPGRPGNLRDDVVYHSQSIDGPMRALGASYRAAIDAGEISGRWPANLILDEEAGVMLDGQTGTLTSGGGAKSNRVSDSWEGGNLLPLDTEYQPDSGGASRFFLNVKQECDLCDSPADSAASSSTTTPATLDTSAPTLAPNWQVEQLAQNAKSAASLCDSCATAIARSLAATPPGNDPEHQAGLASISALGERTLTRSLASYVAALASTGTTPTTASPSLWNGCVRDATRGSIPIDDAENARDLSRFRYVSKASRSERNKGCEGMEERYTARDNGYSDKLSDTKLPRANHHPTVKPVALMRWLVRLVARPGDVVLDPFAGSGTTGVACAEEGREFVGIERELDYVEIARRRIEAASAQGRLM